MTYGPPFAKVGLNLFEYGGSKFLICVDRWSGFPLYKKLTTLTAKAITGILTSWFNIMGWPKAIRSDGGLQFCGTFPQWCASHNTQHELSSPYNPKSNGLAKSGVKNVKVLMDKCKHEWSDFDYALYEWQNSPRSHGYSPEQLHFGRREFTSLPYLPSQFDLYDLDEVKQVNKGLSI